MSTAQNAPNTLRLWDVTCGIDLSAEELEQLGELGKDSFNLSAHSKVAVLAPSDLAFGLARTFEVHRADTTTELRVFREEQAARQWLLSDN